MPKMKNSNATFWVIFIYCDLVYLDNGSIDGLGALQGGRDGDLEVGDGGFQDLGGVSGDVSGLSQVDLFGDDGSGFVDGSDVGFLGLSHVGSGKRDGGGSGNGSGVKEGSGVSSMSQRSGKSSMSQRSGVQEGGGWGRNSGGKQGRNNELLKKIEIFEFWRLNWSKIVIFHGF